MELFFGCFLIGENTDGDARVAHDLDYYVASDAMTGVHQPKIAMTVGIVQSKKHVRAILMRGFVDDSFGQPDVHRRH